MIISFGLWVNQQEIIYGSSQFLPIFSILLEIAEINFVNNLADIDGSGYCLYLLEFLVVGLMHHHTIRVAVLDKVDEFLADHQNSLIPFSLDIVGSFMVNCCKDFSRTKNSVRNLEVRVEVFTC
jgi:hypothetical protein